MKRGLVDFDFGMFLLDHNDSTNWSSFAFAVEDAETLLVDQGFCKHLRRP